MLDPNETIFLRGLYGGKWTELEKKLENLSDEVFNEVMEAEMALAELRPKDLENAVEKIDKDIYNK